MSEDGGFLEGKCRLKFLSGFFIAMGVVAMVVPVQRLVAQQRAWSELAQAGRMATWVLLRQSAGASVVSGTSGSVLLALPEDHQLRIGGGGAVASGGGLYTRLDGEPRVERVHGVQAIALQYVQAPSVRPIEAAAVTDWRRVRGVLWHLQLRARTGEMQRWRVYVPVLGKAERECTVVGDGGADDCVAVDARDARGGDAG